MLPRCWKTDCTIRLWQICGQLAVLFLKSVTCTNTTISYGRQHILFTMTRLSRAKGPQLIGCESLSSPNLILILPTHSLNQLVIGHIEFNRSWPPMYPDSALSFGQFCEATVLAKERYLGSRRTLSPLQMDGPNPTTIHFHTHHHLSGTRALTCVHTHISHKPTTTLLE